MDGPPGACPSSPLVVVVAAPSAIDGLFAGPLLLGPAAAWAASSAVAAAVFAAAAHRRRARSWIRAGAPREGSMHRLLRNRILERRRRTDRGFAWYQGRDGGCESDGHVDDGHGDDGPGDRRERGRQGNLRGEKQLDFLGGGGFYALRDR